MDIEKLISSIQYDIIDPSIDLSSILFKAKILAYRLNNEAFLNWVKFELNGYDSINNLPDYRIIPVQPSGFLIKGHITLKNVPIDLSRIQDSELRKEMGTVRITNSIRGIEELSKTSGGAYWEWPTEWQHIWNLRNQGFVCISATRRVSPHIFAEIVSIARSRLQDFIFKLDYPWDIDNNKPINKDIQALFEITIQNNSGESMTIFNQQNQQNFGSQYNAGNNINFNNARSSFEFKDELTKLEDLIYSLVSQKKIDSDTEKKIVSNLKKVSSELDKDKVNKEKNY